MFFLCDFVLKIICFHRSPSIFTRNETFYERKELLRVFGIMQLTEDLLQKNFSKNFQFLYFLKSFRLRKMGSLFPLGENGFRDFSVPLRVFFWVCKFDVILTILSFYLGSPYDIAYLVFFKSSQLSSQVFAKHGFASVLKYEENAFKKRKHYWKSSSTRPIVSSHN